MPLVNHKMVTIENIAEKMKNHSQKALKSTKNFPQDKPSLIAYKNDSQKCYNKYGKSVKSFNRKKSN